MKIRFFPLALAAALLMTTTGCSKPDSLKQSDIDALQEQISTLEKEIATLSDLLAERSSDGGSSAVDSEAAPNSPSHAPAAPAKELPGDAKAPTYASYADTTALEKDIQALETKVKNTAVPADSTQRITVYLDLEMEIEIFEHKIDQMESVLSADYWGGRVTKEQYAAYSQNLDRLDEQLDLIDDNLDLRFYMD